MGARHQTIEEPGVKGKRLIIGRPRLLKTFFSHQSFTQDHPTFGVRAMGLEEVLQHGDRISTALRQEERPAEGNEGCTRRCRLSGCALVEDQGAVILTCTEHQVGMVRQNLTRLFSAFERSNKPAIGFIHATQG